MVSFFLRNYDIVVRKVHEKKIPRRSPQNYTTEDIKKSVDGLYVAIRGEGAPKSDEEAIIGNNLKRMKGRSLSGKSVHVKKAQKKRSYKSQAFINYNSWYTRFHSRVTVLRARPCTWEIVHEKEQRRTTLIKT